MSSKRKLDPEMTEAVFPSPRPTPRFYPEPEIFSTKKVRPAGTPIDHAPPRPPVKSCPPLSRVFPRRNIASLHAQPVSFRNFTARSLLSPKYNAQSPELYFTQLFEKETPIGHGSFGEVFKARSKDDGCMYAIKKSREPFKNQYDRRRKLEEVAKHEALKPHKNCIKLYKAWEEKAFLYIQTELCEESVHNFLARTIRINEALIWNWFVDLLMAVKHLHDNNLVHMDIKPENAFISFDGVCKLGDFGLVIDLTKKTEVSDAMEGDPKYLAPELLQGKVGKHADIFSLGMFVLEMATDLILPRGGEGWHELRSGRLPEKYLHHRSSAMKTLLGKVLEPDYRSRPTVDVILAYPSVREVLKGRMATYTFLREVEGLVTEGCNDISSPPSGSDVLKNKAEMVTPQNKCDDSTCSEEDMEEQGSRNNSSDLLNSSDEFLVPTLPPPRRAFTTPAIRRRPATSSLNGSPIKRLLFTDAGASTPCTSNNSSPISSSSSQACNNSPHDTNDRPTTPPMAKMDWDEPKPGIEPKNLLNMFEAASDEDD